MPTFRFWTAAKVRDHLASTSKSEFRALSFLLAALFQERKNIALSPNFVHARIRPDSRPSAHHALTAHLEREGDLPTNHHRR